MIWNQYSSWKLFFWQPWSFEVLNPKHRDRRVDTFCSWRVSTFVIEACCHTRQSGERCSFWIVTEDREREGFGSAACRFFRFVARSKQRYSSRHTFLWEEIDLARQSLTAQRMHAHFHKFWILRISDFGIVEIFSNQRGIEKIINHRLHTIVRCATAILWWKEKKKTR